MLKIAEQREWGRLDALKEFKVTKLAFIPELLGGIPQAGTHGLWAKQPSWAWGPVLSGGAATIADDSALSGLGTGLGAYGGQSLGHLIGPTIGKLTGHPELGPLLSRVVGGVGGAYAGRKLTRPQEQPRSAEQAY